MNLSCQINQNKFGTESSLCLDASKTREVGAKYVASFRITQGSGRENTSDLMSCNAAGDKGPPIIIFKGKSGLENNLIFLVPHMPQLIMGGWKNKYLSTILKKTF